MAYSSEHLDLIKKRPEMNPKIIPSLDAVIVKFLEKYEVYVSSPSSKE